MLGENYKNKNPKISLNPWWAISQRLTGHGPYFTNGMNMTMAFELTKLLRFFQRFSIEKQELPIGHLSRRWRFRTRCARAPIGCHSARQSSALWSSASFSSGVAWISDVLRHSLIATFAVFGGCPAPVLEHLLTRVPQSGSTLSCNRFFVCLLVCRLTLTRLIMYI